MPICSNPLEDPESRVREKFRSTQNRATVTRGKKDGA
jgi:hypothetical protein